MSNMKKTIAWVMVLALAGVVGIAEAGGLKLLNGSAEEVKGKYPVQWSRYGGAGGAEWGVSDDAHSGQHSVYLKGTGFFKKKDTQREVIGQSLIVGNSNGYKGEQAYACQVDTEYRFSFWAKGDVKWVNVRALGFTDLKKREWISPTSGARITPTPEWKRCEGSFRTTPKTKKLVLMIGFSGYKDKGMNLGMLWVDDVEMTELPRLGRLRLLNGSAEEVKGKYPVQWGRYGGAGGAEWGASDDAHSGRHSVYLKGTKFLKKGPGSSRYSNRELIAHSLVVGNSNGYKGEQAYACQVDTEYRFSFWAKGDVKWVNVRALGFTDLKKREWISPTSGARITPTPEWKRCEGSFRTTPKTKKLVLMIGFAGARDEGINLGTLWVDDVEMTELFRVGIYRGGQVLGHRGVMGTLKNTKGISAEYVKSLAMKDLVKYHALVIGSCKAVGAREPQWWMDNLRNYVEQCGGSLLLYHDAVGYSRSPLGSKNVFPEIVRGGDEADRENNWPKPYRIVVANTDHTITRDMGTVGDQLPIMYCDMVTTIPGPEGKVLLKSPKGQAVVVVGEVGKGRVVCNGTIIYNRPPTKYDSFMQGESDKAVGTDKLMLERTIEWFAEKQTWLDPKGIKAAIAQTTARENVARKKRGEICIIPTPQKIAIEKTRVTLFDNGQATAAVVVGAEAEDRILAAAEAIREKVRQLGGSIHIWRADKVTARQLASKHLIVLGSAAHNLLSRELIKKHPDVFSGEYLPSADNPGKEGYVIRAVKLENGKFRIVGAGSDVQGTMYAAYSLCYTITKKDDRVVAQVVRVWDKPDFEYRCFGAFLRSPEERSGLDAAKKMIDWYSRHKINVAEDQSRFTRRRRASDIDDAGYEELRAIQDYGKSRGVTIAYTGPWTMTVPALPDEKCMGYIKTGNGWLRPYCWSNERMWAEREKELDIMMEKLQPEIVWWHSIDGGHARLEQHFKNRCARCKKMFQRRAQAEAYYVNRMYKVMRKHSPDMMIAMCIIPYNDNPGSEHKPDIRAFFEEFGKLVPDDVLLVVRENSGRALDGYRKVAGKELYVYQAHYTHYDSRKYVGKIKVLDYLDWESYRDLQRIAQSQIMWKAGRSVEIEDHILQQLCRETFGEQAGTHMAPVLIPDLREITKYCIRASLNVARQTRFNPDYTTERLAEFKEALAHLDKAQACDAAGFFPELTRATITSYRQNITAMQRWLEICRMKQEQNPNHQKPKQHF